MKLTPRFIGLQMKIQFKLQALSYITLAIMFFQPIAFSTIGLILGSAYSDDPLKIITSVIGGGLMGIWGNVMYISAFDITHDRWAGVLEQIIGCPRDISQILRVRCLTNVLVGCASLSVSFLIVSLFFDFKINPQQVGWLSVSILAVLVGFWSMGIILANFTALTRRSKILMTTIEFPILVLSGFFFPVEMLPKWMQWIAGVLPVRWAGSAVHASLTQDINVQKMVLWIVLTLLISAVYYLFSFKLADLVHDKIRINGEAGHI